MEYIITKTEGVFKKNGIDYFTLLNVNNNKLFIFDKSTEILWDMLEQISFNNLYDRLIYNGYKIKKAELFNFLNDLSKCGLVNISNNRIEEEFANDYNQLNEYINLCTSSKTPSVLHVELTNSCNLNCIHCYHDEDSNFLKINDICKLFSELKNSSFVRVILTGGELFLHPNWKDIIILAKKNGLLVSILSNITILKMEDLIFLKRMNIHSIRTSLYGSTAKTHDKITNNLGSFYKTLGNIQKMKKLNLPISVSCTIMKSNKKEIMELKELMKVIGVNISFDYKIIPSRRNTKQISKLMIDRDDFSLLYNSGILDIPKRINCNLGSHRISIDSLGKVYLCDMLRIPVGNILEDNLLNILKNNKSNYLKKRAELYNPIICNNCKYSAYCTRCPGFSWSSTSINNDYNKIQCKYIDILNLEELL